MVSQANPLERISRRFDFNIVRINSLIKVHKNIRSSKIIKPEKDDVLRAAVVLIHATLEDLLRELIRWKRPINNQDFASRLQFQIGNDGTTAKQLSIAELSKLNGQTIDDIVTKSINAHLEKRSFNDATEITNTIVLVGVSKADFEHLLPIISACVERRHNIVHRSDRLDHSETSHGAPKRIMAQDVIDWNTAVGELGDLLFDRLEPVQSKIAARRKVPVKKLAAGRRSLTNSN